MCTQDLYMCMYIIPMLMLPQHFSLPRSNLTSFCTAVLIIGQCLTKHCNTHLTKQATCNVLHVTSYSCNMGTSGLPDMYT